jgi:hypothetical protein
MGSRLLARFVLLLFFIVWTTAAAGAVSIGLDATGTVQAAEAPGFGPKLQAGGGVALVLLVPVIRYLSLTTSLEAFGVLPSDIAGGFGYKGFAGLELGVGLEALFPTAEPARLGVLSLGVAAGAAAALPAYLNTTLYFFYPEVRSGFVVSWQPAGSKNLTFRLEIPVRLQLRRDVDFSLSTGLGVDVYYYLGGPK